MVAPGDSCAHDGGMNDGGMNIEDWRDYATALDDAADGLEAFTTRLPPGMTKVREVQSSRTLQSVLWS